MYNILCQKVLCHCDTVFVRALRFWAYTRWGIFQKHTFSPTLWIDILLMDSSHMPNLQRRLALSRTLPFESICDACISSLAVKQHKTQITRALRISEHQLPSRHNVVVRSWEWRSGVLLLANRMSQCRVLLPTPVFQHFHDNVTVVGVLMQGVEFLFLLFTSTNAATSALLCVSGTPDHIQYVSETLSGDVWLKRNFCPYKRVSLRVTAGPFDQTQIFLPFCTCCWSWLSNLAPSSTPFCASIDLEHKCWRITHVLRALM